MDAVADTRGHLSAASLATGPLMSVPLVSPVSVVSDDRGVVLEVDHRSVGPPHGAPLADDDGEDDLPPHLGGSLLDGGDDEVTDACGGDPPGDSVVSGDGDDLDLFGSGVVDDGEPGSVLQTPGLVSISLAPVLSMTVSLEPF